MYDSLEQFWEHKRTERFAANFLIMVFLTSLALIELARQGLLPKGIAGLPTSYMKTWKPNKDGGMPLKQGTTRQ